MSQIQKSIIGRIFLAKNFETQKAIVDQLLVDFFTDKELEIFSKIKDKIKERVLLDPQNTWQKEENYIIDCIAQTSFVSTLESSFLELQKEYKKRELENISQLKSFLEIKLKLKEIEEKADLLNPTQAKTITEIIEQSIIEQANDPIDLDSLPKTGFKDFDEFYEGFMPQNLITVGGYSGVGKSTFIFSLIKNLAFQHPTLIFNLEMSNSVMSARILSALSGVPFIYTCNLGNIQTQEKIDNYNFREKLNKGFNKIDSLKVKMSDDEFRLDRILTRIRNEAKNGLKFVLIDYLQLIVPFDTKLQRHLQIAQITRELKMIAKELKITIIILAQLGRGSLNKDEPELNDLRESGSIEQDSDAVFLIFKKDQQRKLKLAKDRMFGRFGIADLNYNIKTQSYE